MFPPGPFSVRPTPCTGYGAIVQAPLGNETFYGFADVLLRVDAPSALGPYSYEPLDTKLAQETKACTILQLCVYWP
jgi:hypothetical protein